MRKVKSGLGLCLALLLAVLISTVSVSAQSLDPVSLTGDLLKSDQYLFTHPKEVVQILDSMIEGTPLDETITDSEDAQTFLRVVNLPDRASIITKALFVTTNPTNSEKNRIISIDVTGPENFPTSSNGGSSVQQFTLLSSTYFNKNTINIDPVFAYKTQSNELVVWGVITNYSGKNVELSGIPEIRLMAGDKVLAGGNAQDFDSPLKLSYYQAKVNTGVYNGLPDQCLFKITFEPGTYDGSIDLTDLNNLDCQYSLNYGYLE